MGLDFEGKFFCVCILVVFFRAFLCRGRVLV